MKICSKGVLKSLPIEIEIYDTFLKRFIGLMFRFNPIQEKGVLLIPCNSIHMFFMFFPIDVIFLNEKNEIVSLKENVKPWSVVFPIKDAHAALELPSGTIKSFRLEIDDILKMK